MKQYNEKQWKINKNTLIPVLRKLTEILNYYGTVSL